MDPNRICSRSQCLVRLLRLGHRSRYHATSNETLSQSPVRSRCNAMRVAHDDSMGTPSVLFGRDQISRLVEWLTGIRPAPVRGGMGFPRRLGRRCF